MFDLNARMNRFAFYTAVGLVSANVTCSQASPHQSLEELRRLNLPEVTIESAKQEAAHAKVDGVIGGTIRFELLLPDDWNGRFVMGGGGGFVGTVQNGARDSVNYGYATAGTDTGHEYKPGYSAAWAYTNIEAQVNFGYLGVHRTVEVSKAILREYYGHDAAYSYFEGCSRGGGQAMMEAQRFPKDFDGIVSGAPAFDWTGLAAMAVHIGQALYPDPNHLDRPALDADALQTLQRSIIEQCDAQDGLKDGVVQDPPSAHFDLAKVENLTDEQRREIQAIYQDTRAGEQLLYPGYTAGAECDSNQWRAWIVGPVPLDPQVHAPDLMFAFGTQIWKYLIFNNPAWDYSTYNLSNFTADTRLAASYLDATNADLSGLKAHGGKFILWHGWADPALPAQATVNYYRQVQAHDPSAADFCRLFMVPGCFHCGGGPGASEVDWLTAIVNWVEHNQAPDRLIAYKRENGKIAATRPVFPYPQIAIYKGHGDPASAGSFEARMPANRSN